MLDPILIPRPTVYGDPLPIGRLRPAPDTTYLLWCPEQGGWRTGEWWSVEDEEGWVSTAGNAELVRLDPVAYLPAPPDQDDP